MIIGTNDEGVRSWANKIVAFNHASHVPQLIKVLL